MCFSPLVTSLIWGVSLLGVRREDVRSSPSTGHWSGQTWAPPGHTSTLASEDPGAMWAGPIPSPPEGPTSGKWWLCWGQGWPAQPLSRAGGLPGPHCALPYSPRGPSQQVSFPLLIRLIGTTGPRLYPSQRLCPPSLGATGTAGRTSSRGGQEAPTRAGRSWVCFPTLLCDFVGIWADSPPR